MIAWLREELRRQGRGWQALRAAFGPTFTGAIAFVMGLLLVSLWVHSGIPAFVLGGLLLLLAVRAHDLGDLPLPNEISPEAQREREDDFLAQEQAAQAAVQFLSDRGATALGKPHQPVEL